VDFLLCYPGLRSKTILKKIVFIKSKLCRCLANILLHRQLFETCVETLLYTMFRFGESPPCSALPTLFIRTDYGWRWNWCFHTRGRGCTPWTPGGPPSFYLNLGSVVGVIAFRLCPNWALLQIQFAQLNITLGLPACRMVHGCSYLLLLLVELIQHQKMCSQSVIV
jgi:hypothetical protein